VLNNINKDSTNAETATARVFNGVPLKK
jgi:hypothetical protein